MTTDSVASRPSSTGAGWSVGGMAKGAGMLAPQLATMLVVLTTDAVADAADLDRRPARRDPGQLRPARLRRLHVDQRHGRPAGQRRLRASRRRCRTSPRRSPGPAPTSRCSCSPTPRAPTTRSPSPCQGAASEDDAVEVGRSIARSNLFKAAVFGNDPNWGRVLASIGTTQAAFDPADLDVAMNGVWVCRQSTPAADPATVDLTAREVTVDRRPQGRRRPGDRLDQRPDPRLRPRELGVLLMTAERPATRRRAPPRPPRSPPPCRG